MHHDVTLRHYSAYDKIVRKLLTKSVSYAAKHQSPSTCLRPAKRGFAQAGQMSNNIQIPISNAQDAFISDFGHWVIGNYLGFGFWYFPAMAGFGPGYHGVGG
ncbi:MAG: hypothetical protein H6Q48_2072 [Deltaproteobacteria bacterium]|nr:hypothetical protein [Deltaproteobacteria bacterium]